VPAAGDDAEITASGVYTVTITSNVAIGTLTTAPGATLAVSNGDTLTWTTGSTINNGGAITLDSAGSATKISLNGAQGGTITLDGTGALVLGNNANNSIEADQFSLTFDNNSTIEGSGSIGTNVNLALNNTGTINADQSTPLILQPSLSNTSPTVNTGTLEATNGGTLELEGIITNTGGLIQATGTNSAVSLVNGVSVTDGTLTSSNGGVIQSVSGTLDGAPTITSGSTISVPDNGKLTLTTGSAITNDGAITLDSAGSATKISLNGAQGGTITLDGTGALVLGNNADNSIEADQFSLTFDNNSTIEGSGSIGTNVSLTLNNAGTINADQSTPLILLASVTNNGLLEASNGGLLDVTNAISGTGQLQIGAASEIELGGATSETAIFTGAANAKLRLDVPGSYTGIIASFAPGDILEFANTNALTATPTLNGANTTLTVNLSGGGTLSYILAGNLTNDTFNITHVGSDSDITVTIPLAGQIQLAAATEGAALPATTTVASFTDTNAGDTISTFTASIAWGDGSTSAGTVSGSNGSFTVSGGHTYADEGSNALSVTITDTANNTSLPLSGTVAVAEADVLTPQGASFAANPGQAFTGTVASFTDTNTANVASDFGATITWGDGSTSAGTVTGSNGSFTVSGTHTYAASGQDAVAVTLTDDAPGIATATANSTANVGAALNVQVTLSGTPQEGQRLTANASSNDAQATIHYQWQSSIDGVTFNPIANAADASTYVVQESDEDLEIRVIATAVDTQIGATASAISSPTIAVTDIVPSLSVTIGGAAQQGQTLTAIAVANDSDATITYHWQVLNGANWSNIKGATGLTYTVTELNEGHQLRAVATSTDSDGSGATATSTPTNPVIDVTPTISVTERGVPQEGRILTATVHVTSDGDRGTTTYQWEELIGATWTAIAGSTRRTYTMTEANEGNELRLLATFTDDTGQTVSATSSPTSPILDRPAALSIAHHSLSVPAGGTVALPIRVAEFDSDDTVSVTISGLTSFETVTDKFDDSVFSGSSITLSAAEVNSGLTLHSSYSGSGHPVNTLTVTATNATVGESATTPAQIITVTDPPASGSGPRELSYSGPASLFNSGDAGATLEPISAVSPGQTVVFKSTTGMKLDQAENFSGVVSSFSTTDRTLANSDRIDLVDVNHHSPSSGHQFNSTTDTLTVTDGAKTAPPSIGPSIGHIVMHDPGRGVTPVTMEDPGPAPNRIVAGAPNQTSSGFIGASDNFVFNFARSDHIIMTDFHPHSDVLEFDESIFANAQAILNVLHDDCRGNPVIAVDGHETTGLGGALKAHLHAADFHFI
jgi:hypothetical protein